MTFSMVLMLMIVKMYFFKVDSADTKYGCHTIVVIMNHEELKSYVLDEI